MCSSDLQHEANLITVVTQIGYALGLCFLIPMGDLYSRRRIIVVNMTVAAIMAIVIAVAHKVWLIWGASLLLGACSVIPQFFIPIAGQYSEKKNKSRNMGIVLSGLLTGILASRVVSGYVGEWLGWREMFFISLPEKNGACANRKARHDQMAIMLPKLKAARMA